MTNLTLSIDEGVLKRARIRALKEDSSVNVRVREFLDAYASGEDSVADRQKVATERLIHLAEEFHCGGGLDGRAWTRNDLYER